MRAVEAALLFGRRHTPPPVVPGHVTPESGGFLSGLAPFLLALGALVLLGSVFYLSYAMKQRRRAAFALQAATLGLDYSADDTIGVLSYPFELLQRGDGRGAENVVTGTLDRMDVAAFDYWYYDESTDAQGHTSRSYHRFDCAIVPVDADCPHLVIGRETLLTSLAGALTFHDIQFESEEFNREFNVRCEVPKFASDLIDQRMIDWLLATGTRHTYEVVGAHALVAGPRIDPAELPVLLGAARGFVRHVPKVVSSLYPG